MSRGHHTKDRRERRHRDDRYRDPRDAYPATSRGAYPQEYAQDYQQAYPQDYPTTADHGAAPPPAYEPPAYESDHHHKPRRSKSGRDKAPPLRRRGLNEDYYNPEPVSDDYEKPRRSHRSRRDKDRHARRRSEDRYDSHRYGKPTETDEEPDYYPPKPRRRAQTEERGRERHHRSRRYDDYSDTDRYSTTPEERPGKPKRTQSFLQKMGIGKADKHPEYDRGRSPIRSPSRGRRSHRAYSYSPSPPRHYRSTHRGRAKSAAADGLRNPQWQRAAGSAMRAGASAAYELRHDPSPWMGPKGIRVATAAIGAAMMDQMMEERTGKSGGVRHRAVNRLGEAALAHIVSGGRSKSRGRSRKRY